MELWQDYTGSVRWQHCLTRHTDNTQKLAKWSDCLLGEVMQPSDSRLSEAVPNKDNPLIFLAMLVANMGCRLKTPGLSMLTSTTIES